MRQFIAMLRDSYKEAVDGWIFFVMMVLAGVVILLVGSISVEPLAPAEAIAHTLTDRAGGGFQASQYVSADRGQAPKIAMFLYRVEVSDVAVISPRPQPWDSEVRFTMSYTSAGIGPSGVEVDDAKKPDPKKIKPIETGLFSDAFKEAVRYWAGKPGEVSRPAYSDALAIEFVTTQVHEITRLDVKSVEKVSGGNKFVVTTQGGSAIGWAHKPSLLFGLVPVSFLVSPLGQLIHLLEDTLINGFGAWVVLLAGVIVTAGFIPNMLRKGAIDLLLTKPMSRPVILLYKYLGGLLFVALLTTFTIGGVWLAIGVRTGVWATGLLYCIGGITFYFAILYACSTLFGVLTRNAIVSIVVTIVFWFTIWLIGTIHSALTLVSNLEVQRERPTARKVEPTPKDAEPKTDDKQAEEPAIVPEETIPRPVMETFRVLNAMTPRTKDLDNLTSRLIGKDLLSVANQRQAGFNMQQVRWGEVAGVATAYIAVFLGLAMLRFVTRSY